MAVFRNDPSEWQRLDWRLMQNGAVAMYFLLSVLGEDIAWLRRHNYEIYEFDCAQWLSDEKMHADLKRVLGFPDYYGKNLDAFPDCLSDLKVRDDGGAAIVLYRFDVFSGQYGGTKRAEARRTIAEYMADILAGTAQRKMLFGSRMITMLQSDNPLFRIENLGCVDGTWNPREWLDKDRRVK